MLKVTQLVSGKVMFLTETVVQGSFFVFDVFIFFWYVPNDQTSIELFLHAGHSPYKAFCLAEEIQIKQMFIHISICITIIISAMKKNL